MASKEDDLLAVARVLSEAGLAWALISGLAYQIHAREPRTTLDIDTILEENPDLVTTLGDEERGRLDRARARASNPG